MNEESSANKEKTIVKSDESVFKVPAPISDPQLPKRSPTVAKCSVKEVDVQTTEPILDLCTRTTVIRQGSNISNQNIETHRNASEEYNDNTTNSHDESLDKNNIDSNNTKEVEIEITNINEPVPLALVMNIPEDVVQDKQYRLILTGKEDEFHAIDTKTKKIQLGAEDNGPSIYSVNGNYVSKPFITGRLAKAFESLPVFGSPRNKAEAEKLKKNLLVDFACGDLTTEQAKSLEMYCSPDNLLSGVELKMPTKHPVPSFTAATEKDHFSTLQGLGGEGNHFQTIKKLKMRIEQDTGNTFVKKLKYRGLRYRTLGQTEDGEEPDSVWQTPSMMPSPSEPMLVPGKDLLYRVRVYRPFPYSPRARIRSGNRHPLLVCDIMLLGRHTLQHIRDKIECINDVGMRIDISEQPERERLSSCKELFPSGFLFINNVFYNDRRPGCFDYSATLREWAEKRGIGTFKTGDMQKQKLDQLTIRLGYPEVYVHQGDCEHLFTFSEVRLVGLDDPLSPSNYPCTTVYAQNHSMYCTSCAEFSARWIATNSSRVPFDPAFFCDTCFKLYMYKDGGKIGDFKAYAYKNE